MRMQQRCPSALAVCLSGLTPRCAPTPLCLQTEFVNSLHTCVALVEDRTTLLVSCFVKASPACCSTGRAIAPLLLSCRNLPPMWRGQRAAQQQNTDICISLEACVQLEHSRWCLQVKQLEGTSAAAAAARLRDVDAPAAWALARQALEAAAAAGAVPPGAVTEERFRCRAYLHLVLLACPVFPACLSCHQKGSTLSCLLVLSCLLAYLVIPACLSCHKTCFRCCAPLHLVL